MLRASSRVLVLGVFASLGGHALAADTCRTFDRVPACCPHPPPVCCPTPVLVDDALVQSVCGASTAKGQSYLFDECKQYYERGDEIGEVVFGREAGDSAALAKVRARLIGPRAQLSDINVTGAKNAFVMRSLDERGKVEGVAIWALVGSEVVHLEADAPACSEAQAITLLTRALERARAK